MILLTCQKEHASVHFCCYPSLLPICTTNKLYYEMLQTPGFGWKQKTHISRLQLFRFSGTADQLLPYYSEHH